MTDQPTIARDHSRVARAPLAGDRNVPPESPYIRAQITALRSWVRQPVSWSLITGRQELKNDRF